MKAIRVNVFGEPDVLKFEEVPDPLVEAGQILIRVHAIGINPFETYIRSGKYAILPALPYTPGVDCAGVVEQVGAGVSTFAVGDRVYTAGTVTGAYAEMTVGIQHQVHRLPDNVSCEQGAALGVPYGTAYRAVHHLGHGMQGQTILVHGASGGVGIAAVELAHGAGLTVVGTASTEEGRMLAREHGAEYVMDHDEATDPTKLQATLGSSDVNLVVEMAAHRNLGNDLRIVASGGLIVVVGSRGPIEIDPRQLMSGEKTIQGLTLFAASAQQLAESHEAIIKGLEDGTLRPVVGRKFPLSEAAEAHKAVLASGSHGKIVLIP